MSRIDEAWARAAGATAHKFDDVSRAARQDTPPQVLITDFPAETDVAPPPVEIAAPAPIAVEPIPVRPATPAPAPVVSAPGPSVPLKNVVAVKRHWKPLSGPGTQLGRKLVVSPDASPVAVEQYRRLAGVLHDLQVEHGLKMLMVTSAVPGEGKTLTIANLALTLSEACQRRVLLIDADLRRPTVHQLFGLPNDAGLSDVLRSDQEEMPMLQLSDYLTVLPAGHLDQPMALTSSRMDTLLEQVGAEYDWVLIDSAPVGFMPEARLLARMTRAVLFVIAANSTPHTLVSRAVAEIGAESIVGTVLNSVDDEDIPAAAYYQDYYLSGAR